MTMLVWAHQRNTFTAYPLPATTLTFALVGQSVSRELFFHRERIVLLIRITSQANNLLLRCELFFGIIRWYKIKKPRFSEAL